MTHQSARRTEPRGENVLPLTRHREPLLSLVDISLARNGHSVLDRVSFDLGRGETLGLVGESGAGKSTIALVAMGLLRPPAVTLEGRMQFAEHENLLAEPEAGWAALRGRRIAMIFQDPASALNPLVSIALQPGGARSNCWRVRVSTMPRPASPPSRTNSPAACSSG